MLTRAPPARFAAAAATRGGPAVTHETPPPEAPGARACYAPRMRLYVVLDLHGQASVRGVYDDEATARAAAGAEPAYFKVHVCELNAAPLERAQTSLEDEVVQVLRAPAAPSRPSPATDTPATRPTDAPLVLALEPTRASARLPLEVRLQATPRVQLAHTALTTDSLGRDRDEARVLIRVLHRDPFDDPAVLRRLSATLGAASAVYHPSWAAPRWLGTLGEDAALVWAWPAGATLSQWRAAHPDRVSADFVVGLLFPLLGAAQAMHDEHPAPLTICLHPAQVLVAAEGPDLLLGAPLSPALAGVRLVRPDVLAAEGEPTWWGPEVLDGLHGPRSTVHTAGMTALWLLADTPPWLGPTSDAAERAAAVAELARARPELPRALLDVVARAIAAAPSERPADPAALAEALLELGYAPAAAEHERARVLARL
jgi:hypothetical protein